MVLKTLDGGDRRLLAAQTEDWERIAGVMTRLLGFPPDP